MKRRPFLLCFAFLPVFVAPFVVAQEPVKDDEAAVLAREVHDLGWIAYCARTGAGDWDLFLMRPDGSDSRNITNTPGYTEAGPRFSPDGKRLLYRRMPKDAVVNHDKWGFQGELVIAEADGDNPEPVGGDGDYPWATWSPDGTQIACLTLKGIQIVNLETRETVRTMPREGMYQQLAWSNDGKWFCGVTNRFGESWTVARMNLETGEINPVNKFQNCTPDWFPDSKRLIFSHRPGNQDGYGWTQLWMADGDGSHRGLVFGEDGRHIYGGEVSPDMKYVIFTASKKDGGGSENNGAPMYVMRLSDAPTIHGESTALRKIHPDAKNGVLVPLPVGWEPDWTAADAGGTP